MRLIILSIFALFTASVSFAESAPGNCGFCYSSPTQCCLGNGVVSPNKAACEALATEAKLADFSKGDVAKNCKDKPDGAKIPVAVCYGEKNGPLQFAKTVQVACPHVSATAAAPAQAPAAAQKKPVKFVCPTTAQFGLAPVPVQVGEFSANGPGLGDRVGGGYFPFANAAMSGDQKTMFCMYKVGAGTVAFYSKATLPGTTCAPEGTGFSCH